MVNEEEGFRARDVHVTGGGLKTVSPCTASVRPLYEDYIYAIDP